MLPREIDQPLKRATIKEASEAARNIRGGSPVFYNETKLDKPRIAHDPKLGFVVIHETPTPPWLHIPPRIRLDDLHLIVTKSEPA